MEPYTFRVESKDLYGCTHFDKHVFKKNLNLTHTKPVTVVRANGTRYCVNAIKCVSKGTTFYQLDLSELRLHEGGVITVCGLDGEENAISLLVVEPSEHLWKRGGVVDAIVDLQKRVELLEDRVLEDDLY